MKYGKMDHKTVEDNAELYSLLSNTKRLAILNILAEKERSLGELTDIIDASKSNISQHLNLLKAHGLLTVSRDGVNAVYSLKHPDIVEACHILKRVRKDMNGV